MYTQKKKRSANKSRVMAHSVTQKRSEIKERLRIEDNRPHKCKSHIQDNRNDKLHHNRKPQINNSETNNCVRQLWMVKDTEDGKYKENNKEPIGYVATTDGLWIKYEEEHEDWYNPDITPPEQYQQVDGDLKGVNDCDDTDLCYGCVMADYLSMTLSEYKTLTDMDEEYSKKHDELLWNATKSYQKEPSWIWFATQIHYNGGNWNGAVGYKNHVIRGQIINNVAKFWDPQGGELLLPLNEEIHVFTFK